MQANPRCVAPAAFVLAFLYVSTSSASFVVTYPSSGNHVHQANNGSVVSTLGPDPVENVSEFFLLSAVSQATQDELASGDTSFSGWTFDYTGEWGNANGNLILDTYKATTPFTAFGGAELTARYQKDSGDPATLRWIQLVDPIQPFDPDASYNTTTGDLVSNGSTPPANGVFIDPYPNDGSDGGPFYWHGGEIASHTSGSNSFGSYDLEFRDFPQAPVDLSNPNTNGAVFELYLVSWDGSTSVDFLGGIGWGYSVIPEPSTGLLVFGGLLFLGARRRR